ncbi:tumor necrosis factor receptor superfamily member 4 isoform X3 [Phascolarctos cinereus]|uniref:Tumor necrosis factor receptor superfamily member 4 isoform X3 n=1 Tax=Phascolarctos cinereus TaxID=38626 RepID=A0A6P5JDJ8_PHACI|nr:tumor necrosis factor receptor superfamily member 4 isoform X3 [Phascolarctos cinereus]
MTGWHRYLWRLVTLLCLLAAQLRLASLHQCGKNSYSSAGQCCQYCKPGSGSQVLKNCTASSDTVCQCTPGTQPVETFKWGVECSRCPPGHFSLGENSMCKPWTNCTAIGKRTLRAGSPQADADCEDARTPGPPRSPPTSARTTTTSSSSSTAHLRVTTQSVGVLSTFQSLPDKPWSPFSVIFLVLLLLLVFGVVMLVLGISLSKRDKRQLPAIWKPPGTHSFRMPIQEEHQSSLAKV